MQVQPSSGFLGTSGEAAGRALVAGTACVPPELLLRLRATVTALSTGESRQGADAGCAERGGETSAGGTSAYENQSADTKLVLSRGCHQGQGGYK